MVKEKGQLGRYSSSTLDSVIQEIALIVASTLDINEVYEGFTLKTKGLVDFDRIYIDVLDLETGYHSVDYMSGSLPPDWRPGKSKRPQGTQTHTVVSAGQSLIRYDIAQDRRFTDDEDSLTAGLRSSIAVPLVTKGKVIGTLGLQSCGVGAYEAAEQAVLEKLANLIAPSVENATLYQRLQEHAQEMALADEVARVITSTLEIDQVYEQFAQEMKKLVDFDRVVVNVVDEDCRNFTIKYSAGLGYPGRQVGDTSPLEGTQTQYVVTSGQTLVRPDLQADPRFVGDQALLDVGIKSVIVIPLNSKGKVIGVLIANSRWINAFGMREHAILERLAKQIAPAVENSELYYQVHAATQEMALVDEVARIITSTLEIDEVYDQFAREMRKLLDFERMVINSVDPEAGTYTLRYIYGQYRPGRPIGVATALASSQNEEVVRTGQTLIRNDFASDLRFQSDQELAALGLRASIMAPLIVKGRIIGTIGLRSRNVAAYGQRERAILERLSKQIAPAIENADLYQMVQESTQEIDLVDQVARIITSTLDIDQVYEKFANEMKKLVDFDRAFVNIVDEEAGTFMIKYVSGIYLADRLPGQVKPLNGSQIDYVVKSGKTLCRSDVAQETMFKADEEQMRWGARSSIAVPLISKGRAIGILGLRSRLLGAYGPREQAILERLASQIAPAIENAELYQQLQAGTEEMEVVNEVARIMTSTLHIDQVCEEFAREMRKLVDFERASISMVDRESRTYTPQYVFGGPRSNEPIGSVSPLAGSMTGAVVETGRTLVRRDISSPEGGEFLDDQVHLELGLHSCIALPLISKGQVIGSMILRSRRTNCYGPREQALLERLTRQIAPGLENAQLYDEARNEKELATTTLAQLKGVLSSVDSGLLFVDNNRDTLWANHRYGEFFGIDDVESLAMTHRRQVDRREILRRTFADPERVFDERMRIYAEPTFAGPTEEVDLVYPARRILKPFTTPVYDESGESLGRLWVYHDITQSRAAEEQLLQFQKMESIGRLAGGIAHDFNNLLTAIMGYSQLAMLETPANGYLCSHVQEIQRASERASNLTSQLLAFSRRQVAAPKVINLNDLILNLERLLRRLISEDIELVTLPSPDSGLIKADPNQMEQVLVNLVVNARDAMPSGGKLVIETSTVNVDAQLAQQYLGLAAGSYVMLSVRDTGIGMSEEVKAHLFEPFFTTKEVGKGTGLGLATCYGIVKQSGGYIEAISEPGQGSSIKVYLPRSDEVPAGCPGSGQATPSTGGTETVLLAEDDPLVRSMVANVLTDQGYTVIQASNGDEALRLAQEQGRRRIDLLLSDVVMPQMGGIELARRISKLRPRTKIILTSGYSEEPIFHNGTPGSKIEFIQKPFIPAALASKVRDVLDRDD